MLFCQDLEEGVAKRPLGALALAGYGYRFVGARRGLMLDEVFEVVVIDVICRRALVIGGSSMLWDTTSARTMAPFWYGPLPEGVAVLHANQVREYGRRGTFNGGERSATRDVASQEASGATCQPLDNRTMIA